MAEATRAAYPVTLTGNLDEPLSRWLFFFKWLLLVPHLVVLAFLWVAFAVLTIFAFFAILFTGRYPRGMFDFNVGVLRWTWRVSFYGYQALGTDKYPPFSLKTRDYPANLEIEYPERLHRGLVLVKWWLLAIPHYLIVSLMVGGAGPRQGSGLVGILVLISAVILLFTGKYHKDIFRLVMQMNRWAMRVVGYAALMTDEYPPFRLDD
ncbi:MAG: DUF4389 domain-containing protein [Chloroflexi bacterium]|nr:DUF4389 domain-containing protein [Chloroflexota bacterium]MCI0769861.1 DUF4389 domain-containing protein [Chloroflexota bacterium]